MCDKLNISKTFTFKNITYDTDGISVGDQSLYNECVIRNMIFYLLILYIFIFLYFLFI